MKRRYVPEDEAPLSGDRLALALQAGQIVDGYRRQGLTMTLRQLYYQFVARDLIPNTDRSYKRLGDIVSKARLQGLLDWNMIEDRTRVLRGNTHWDSPDEIIDAAVSSFRFDLWADQDYRVEVWIEKEALLGVIAGPCRELDVDYFACKGYVSLSEMWRAGRRIHDYAREGQRTVILHLGDHDPSGIQMTDDISARLTMHTLVDSQHVHGMVWRPPIVERIALNMDQVEEYQPPPNPAKLTDSRAGAYVEQFGRSSWELDALDPATLRGLIEDNVARYRDDALMSAAQRRQDEARAELAEAADEIRSRWSTDEEE